MLGTQAVETIDAVFSTYFLFHVFLCFLLPTPAPHLSARHDLHKYQTIPLNICQENSWDPCDITISRFRIYTVFMSVLHELFLHVTLRPASRVRRRRVVAQRRLRGVCDSGRKARPRRRVQRARGCVKTYKSSISNHAGLRGIKPGKHSRRSLHSTAAFGCVLKWKLQLWLRMHGYFTDCFFQHFCFYTRTEANSYRWNRSRSFWAAAAFA